MGRVSPIQESFQAGFIGRRIRGRVSIDAYKTGVAEANNWHPLVQGPMRLRQGSEYRVPIDSTNWVSGNPGTRGVRVYTFQRGLDNDVIVEVGEALTKVLGQTGQQQTGGVTGELISDPTFLNVPTGPLTNSAEWQTVSGANIYHTDPGFPQDSRCSYDISTLLQNVYPPSGPQLGVRMHTNSNNSPDGFYSSTIGNQLAAPVLLPAGSELELNEFRFTYIQYTSGLNPSGYDVLLPLPWADPKLRVNIGTAPGLGDVFTTDIPIGVLNDYSEQVLNFTPGAGNNTLYFTVGWIWTGTTVNVPLIDTGLPCSNKNMAGALCAFSWKAPLAGGSLTPVEFVTPWTAEQMECLQYCMDPGEQVAYFMHPEVETHRLRVAVGEWTFEPISTITAPTTFAPPTPNVWVAGNYPSAGCFHEGRLWLGGSPNQPATLWASRSGDYSDFNGTTPASKDDPLLFPLSSAGNIQTLTSRTKLVVNTDVSEVLGTSVDGVISFDDFSFPKQTDWGSHCIQPMVVGRSMVFTSNSRTRIRTFEDGGDSIGGWDGNELSLLATELFGFQVRKMIYLDEPAYQACFLLADGTIAMATYFYPENVIGWWKMSTSHNGDRTYGDETMPGLPNQAPNAAQNINQIMDITKINTSGGAHLWMVVNRVGYSGTLVPGHEVMAVDDPSRPDVTLDSFASRPVDPATGVLLDLDHLTDQSVNCVIERLDPISGVRSLTVHPNITVIAGFSSELEDWAKESDNTAHVGLFYDNNFKLLPREGVSQRGTSQVSKRRWNKVVLRLNESAIPLVNGEYPRDRHPSTPMGTGEPIVSTDAEYSELGSDQGELNVNQDKPIITEVLAIFGKLISGEV